MRLEDYIEQDLLEKFEFHNYNHAIEIITQAFPEEWADIVSCLRKLDITIDDLRQAGGNETNIPKKFDDVLYPLGWREIRISGDLHIKFYPRRAEQRGRFSDTASDEKTITKAPGIGKKTAQKLILELKDKFSLEEAFDKRLENAGSIPAGSGVMNDAKAEAVEALTALGYSNADALKAVKKAAVSEEMDTEAILKAALKKM